MPLNEFMGVELSELLGIVPYLTWCVGIPQLFAISAASSAPDFDNQRYAPPKRRIATVAAMPILRFNPQNSDHQLLATALQRNIVMLLPRILQLLVPQLPQPQRNPLARIMRVDDLIDITA